MEAPEYERRLVAVLAADVVGYSRLMQEDEEATLATLSAHRRIIDGLIAAGRGHICNTAGDSILAEFVSVVDAVNCAVTINGLLTPLERRAASLRLPKREKAPTRPFLHHRDSEARRGRR